MNDKELAKTVRTAIKEGVTSKVVTLLTDNRDLLTTMTPFGTWLHVAASHGRIDIVKCLLDLGVDVNAKGGIAGGNALHLAASNGHLEIVKCLLASGAEMDVTEPERNPLFGAIYGGHTDVAKLLIENGINTHARYTGKNMQNMDALAFAQEWGRIEIAELLSKKEHKPG